MPPSAGIPPTYVVVPGEGHDFPHAENDIELLGWIEDFLSEDLLVSGEVAKP